MEKADTHPVPAIASSQAISASKKRQTVRWKPEFTLIKVYKAEKTELVPQYLSLWQG